MNTATKVEILTGQLNEMRLFYGDYLLCHPANTDVHSALSMICHALDHTITVERPTDEERLAAFDLDIGAMQSLFVIQMLRVYPVKLPPLISEKNGGLRIFKRALLELNSLVDLIGEE